MYKYPLYTAEAFAERGLPIFPVNGDKKPMVPGGFHSASLDIDGQIREWKRTLRPRAWAVDCGAADFDVIDVDIKNNPDALITWLSMGYETDSCLIVQTPSLGRHFYYSARLGYDIHNSASLLAKGIDVRGNGGYVVLPGSMVATGFYKPLNAWIHRPMTIPEALAIKLTEKPKSAGQSSSIRNSGQTENPGKHWLEYYLQRACVGTRNDTGFKLAIQLQAEGLTISQAESFLIEYARCVPGTGYDEKEALATLKSVYRRPALEPAKAI